MGDYMETDVLLLTGPDDRKYRAIFLSDGTWQVNEFMSSVKCKSSCWWKTQISGPWFTGTLYPDKTLKDTFTILAATKAHIDPHRRVYVHWN